MAHNTKREEEGLQRSLMVGLHKTPAVATPTITELSEIAKRNNMQISDSDLIQYQDFMAESLKAMTRIDRLSEPTLPVKYPRTPGYRPSPEENPHNAWYWKTHIEGAKSGKLHGKKIAIKDTVMVAGVPMMNGCRALEGYTADTDATVVTRILDEGGIIAGKSTCENLCYSGSSFTTGKGPVTNYHDPTRSAGGSSSGSAVLIASGEVDMAIGGDQGGSVRLPAAWSGIVGLKPTFGLVPYTGAMGLDMSLDHLGPMAKTVVDCASLLEVIAGYDNGLDPRQPPNITVPEYSKLIQVDRLDGVKIGLLKEGFGLPGSDPRVEKAVRESVYKLESFGAEIMEVSIPLHLENEALWNVLSFKGTYNTTFDGSGNHIWSGIGFQSKFMGLMNGGGYGTGFNGFYPTSLITTAGMAFRSQTNDFDPTVKASILLGDYMQSHYYGKYYAKAQNLRRSLRDAYDQALQTCDVIAMPTIPFLATKIPKEGCSMKEYFDLYNNMAGNVDGANLTGHPSLSFNCSTLDDLPVGLMIISRNYSEEMLFKVAHVYEKHVPM